MSLVNIRKAEHGDAAAIADLVRSTSLACCFSPEAPCPDWYLDSIEPDRIADHLRNERMAWFLATQREELAGVLAVADSSHVKYFFVHPAFHQRGIGRQLWQCAESQGAMGATLTVRSSLFAVPVYERLGFVATELGKQFNGMQYQTMAKNSGPAVPRAELPVRP